MLSDVTKKRIATMLAIALILAAIIGYFYWENSTIHKSDIEITESIASCLAVTGLAAPKEECMSKFEVSETNLNKSSARILRLSKDNLQAGIAYLSIEDFESAKDYLNNAYLEDMENQKIWKPLVFSLINLQKYDLVGSICNNVLEQNENDQFCLDIMGIAYYMLDENNKALEMGNKSMQLSNTTCRRFNAALYYGGVGNIERAKSDIDRLINESKTLLLKCWSPVKTDIPDSDIDRYDICFFNKVRAESVCRAFVQEGWRTKAEPKEENVPEPVYDLSQ